MQRLVERIKGNVKWIIRLSGGNNYAEGTWPPPLEKGVDKPGEVVWRDWNKKMNDEKMKDLGYHGLIIAEHFKEIYGLVETLASMEDKWADNIKDEERVRDRK